MDISVMLLLLYFFITKLLILCTYSAVETQTDQQPDETIQCRHEPLPVYVQPGKQQWSHIKILKDSPKQYEYILQLIMKVCITFYAFLNPSEKKSDF